jgi:DNA mismatch endonuclease (patch repair protein)
MDHVSSVTRSKMMSRIRGKDTQPELKVRKYLNQNGLRFRLHVATLPGKPDLVFPCRRTCLFVHGCFWHGCEKCTDGRRKPLSNRHYWLPKIRKNKRRDKKNLRTLRAAGWTVIAIWECEVSRIRKLEQLRKTILSR